MSPSRLLTMLALAALAACYTGSSVGAGAAGGATTTTTTAPAAAADLPCDVANLLGGSCASCHGEPLSGGATIRLLDSADLTAPSSTDPSKTVAEEAVARMTDSARPMPPTGLLGSDRVAILQSWISAGTPSGTCATGATDTNTPTVCTSNRRWTRGDRGSSSMHPGVACIACHSSSDGPRFAIAGTVYPTAHEPDDCNGSPSGVTVIITDANGTAHSLPVNGAGNFYSSSRIATPYTATVTAGGRTRAMSAAQTSGDCNSCHTEQGAKDAPGRIMAP